MALGRAQRAAWDTYLAVTVELLPTLQADPVDDCAVAAELTRLATRIRLWAPRWGAHGTLLTTAADSALRLHHNGHHTDLVTSLRTIAHRLFLLSSERPGKTDR